MPKNSDKPNSNSKKQPFTTSNPRESVPEKTNTSDEEFSPDLHADDWEEADEILSTKKLKKVKKSNKDKNDSSAVFGKELRGYAAGKTFGNNIKVKIPNKIQTEEEEGIFMNDEHSFFDVKNAEMPSFLREETVLDSEMRRPSEECYDPTTLYIPPNELNKYKPLLRQYWDFKKKHFDKLVAIKVWKFYYFYYNDAIAVHKIIDMKLVIWGAQTSTFFHESCLARFFPKLLEAGYKIAIVEQMQETKSKDGLIERDVCQILTRGTAIENQELDYSSRFMLALFEDNLQFGLAFVDTTTHEFYIGEIKDQADRSNLRTLLMRHRPVEVVYMKSFITQETLNLIKSISASPVLSMAKFNEPRHFEDIFERLEGYFRALPKFLVDIKSQVTLKFKNERGLKLLKMEKKVPFYLTLQTIGIVVEFFENILLAETTIPMANFIPLDLNIEKKSFLYLDSQALESLEVINVPYLDGSLSEKSSLFGYMDYTVSSFGKRMFKKWVLSPLLSEERIKERQNAVRDLLENNQGFVEYYQGKLKKLPDIERMISRVYNLSNRKRMSAVYFEDFAQNRLKDFLMFLKELKKVEELVVAQETQKLQSKRLRELTSFNEVNNQERGLFPRVAKIICEYEKMVKIEDGIPQPAPGTNKENDQILCEIKEVQKALDKYLCVQQKRFNSKEIQYVHARRLRYQLEIPEKLVEGKKRPKEFAIMSKRKGFIRFYSPEIEENLKEMSRLEEELKGVLVPFICAFFKKFYENNSVWRQLISCLAELDCLCSLARLALSMKTKYLPEIIPFCESKSVFQVKGMVHPILEKCVRNDFVVEKRTFLITGPNMGGKSTMLRQVCLLTIMAQMGSFVPAEFMQLSLVDRIFTRMGAFDRILEGKSTFLIEMEETRTIVKEATTRSLIVMDELGRGTSTYDGLSIAFATLKYITERIGCITLFATHYYSLVESFRLYKDIGRFTMLAEVDEEKKNLKFLYKFSKGEASRSHGVIVAKMAGLPEMVLERAQEKAESMTKESLSMRNEIFLTEKFNNIILTLNNNLDVDIEEILLCLKIE